MQHDGATPSACGGANVHQLKQHTVQQHYRSTHNASTSKQCTAESDGTALLVLQVRDQGIPLLPACKEHALQSRMIQPDTDTPANQTHISAFLTPRTA
jgi:hypothetical protein